MDSLDHLDGPDTRYKRINRIQEIKEQLKGVSLAGFTADEMKSFYRILGIECDIPVDPNEEDLKLLEQKLRQLKK